MTKSTHAQAAAQIRAELKRNNIQARVTCKSYSMGSSVTIRTHNLPPHAYTALKAFCDQYQYGHFNGMEDIYEYSNNNDDLPQVKFVSVERQFDNDLIQAAWTELRARLQGMDEYPADYVRASGTYEVSNQVFKYMTGYQSDFIFSQFAKPKVRA